MLLLGAGESGKSTILKQMKLINEGSYTDKEREAYKEIIYSNTVQSMHVSLLAPRRRWAAILAQTRELTRNPCALSQVILDAMEMMGLELAGPEGQRYREVVMAQPHQIEADVLPAEVTEAITELWRDPAVRQCFSRSREYQLNDSAQ